MNSQLVEEKPVKEHKKPVKEPVKEEAFYRQLMELNKKYKAIIERAKLDVAFNQVILRIEAAEKQMMKD